MDKIGLFSFYTGALPALIFAAKQKDLKAAAIFSGVYNLDKAQSASLFDTKLSQEELKKRSSNVKIDKLNCPVLVIPNNENKLPLFDQSSLLQDELKKHKKEFNILKTNRGTGLVGMKSILLTADYFRDKYALDKNNLVIKTNNKTKAELITKTKLDSMILNMDLTKYIYSDKVLIQEGLRSRSHPFLILATQHNHDDHLLLSTFLHEQIHWHCKTKINTIRLIQELRSKFPNAPVGLEKGGGINVKSTYLHLIVNYFEYKAMQELFGIATTKRTIKKRDVYDWIYQTIFDNEDYFENLLSKK